MIAEDPSHVNIPGINWTIITTEEVRREISSSKNWLAYSANPVISVTKAFQPMVTEELTYLFHKNDTMEYPADMKPITCLPTLNFITVSKRPSRMIRHWRLTKFCPTSRKVTGLD